MRAASDRLESSGIDDGERHQQALRMAKVETTADTADWRGFPGFHDRGLLQLLAVTVLAATAPAQDRNPVQDHLTAAKRMAEQGRREDALLLAWRLDTVLLHQPPSPDRTRERATLTQLLQDLDPNLSARLATMDASAKRFSAMADAYRKKAWFEVAGVCLRFAGELDPEEAQKDLLMLARERQRAEHPEDVPPPAGEVFLAKAKIVEKAGDWWLDQIGTLRSPPLQAGEAPTALWLTDLQHGDGEIRCECYIGAGDGWIDLTLGATDINNCYVVGLVRHLEDGEEGVRGGHIVDGAWQGTEDFQQSLAGDADGFHRLVVRVRGKQLEVEADGRVLGVCNSPREVRGKLGFLVSGINTARTSMWIRRLSISPAAAAPTDPIAALFGNRVQHGVRARATLDRCDALLRQKQYEAVILLCDQARGDLLAMPPGAERQQLLTRSERSAGIADDLRNRCNGAVRETARSLLALAKQYAAADLPRAAAVLCRSAARFDLAAAEPRLREAQTAVRQQLVAQGKPEELQPPPDDGAVLPPGFGSGQLLDARQTGWVVTGSTAKVPALPDGAQSCLVPAGKMACAAAGGFVQVPEQDMAVGFCFAVRGPEEYSVCCLRRDEAAIWLELRSFAGHRWRVLASKRLDVPEWRQLGWFEVKLQVGLVGAMATVGGTRVSVDARQLGNPLGAVGLFAANGTGRELPVELRALSLRE